MTKYTIEQGKHSANGLHFGVHFGITEQKYKVRFSKDCLYIPLDWENDYNKLCGWSYGMHHKNSIRVCWRPYVPNTSNPDYYMPTQIELCIYVYEDEVRKISEKTIVVNVEEYIEFYLGHDVWDKAVDLQILGTKELLSLKYLTKPSWGYRLFPFFGGNKPAGQDIIIELERL